MVDIIKRTTLIVRDVERAADWYQSVFGMTRWLDTPFTLSGIGLAAGNKGDQTHLVIMKCVDPTIGMIGLLQWVEPKLDVPEEIPKKVGFGSPIFVVASDDATGAWERAKAQGSHIHSDPRKWSFTDPTGKTKAMIGTSFFDLDGYFFEVNQAIENEA
jgi:catechol 2,3-dioxygenase-like lactoylglutathione lyase family enzyme